MKKILFFTLSMNVFLAWSQVGIGTTNPQETLHIDGTLRIEDGNEQIDRLLVSDVDGKATWTNVNDGVRTRIIREINGGTTTEVTLWTHPEGIVVKFHPGTEVVTVENNSGDTVDYWDISTIGGAKSANTTKTSQYNFKFIRDGESFSHDLDSGDPQNRGLFTIIASDQDDQKDGFIMNIVFFGDDINGIVQYWDN